MRKKILNYLGIIFLIMVSMFVTYDNPKLVETPKKIIKYYLKQIGLIDTFHIDEKKESSSSTPSKDQKIQEFFANSFTLSIKKHRDLKGKTAGIIFDDKNLNIFTQSGELISNEGISEIYLPLNFTENNEGGVKSVFFFNNDYYALISRQSINCNYASLINIKKKNVIFDTKCIPDPEKVNFAGLGGAHIIYNNDLLLTIGTPTHYSDEIDKLAQEKDFLYGKTLLIKKNQDDLTFSIFSTGHRNPQGLVEIDGEIYSTEHGPQGGDELNKILINKNYGWPLTNLGRRYGGASYLKKSKNFESPIFSFLPAIAPSSLTACPKNLKSYYKEYTCLLGLTLKEMSMIVYLLDDNNKLISYEKILIEKRMRNFALNKDLKLYFDQKNNFYFSSDKDGIYQAKFKDFK